MNADHHGLFVAPPANDHRQMHAAEAVLVSLEVEAANPSYGANFNINSPTSTANASGSVAALTQAFNTTYTIKSFDPDVSTVYFAYRAAGSTGVLRIA
jgi:hypothetical protein